MTTPLKIVSPESFGLDYFPEFEDTDELDIDFPAAPRRVVKPVSYILVLSSADEVWPLAFKLYLRQRKAYPDKKVEMVLVLDCENDRYNAAAEHHFAKRYSGCALQEIKWSEIAKQKHISQDSLWVLPQRKSYIISQFPNCLYYVKNDDMGYWWFRSKYSKELLLQDIHKLAELDQEKDAAREFLRIYTPKNYKKRWWNLYWWYRRLCRFILFFI